MVIFSGLGQARLSSRILSEDDEDLALRLLLLFEDVGQSQQPKDQRDHHEK